MENERQKKLLESMKKFNKDQKSEVFTLGSEIQDPPVIPSGIEEFDKFIGGGFKRSAHTLVYGAFSVGKTALILTTVANAQKTGHTVCYVNTEKPISPDRFEFFGIDLSTLSYIEAPENAEFALEALRTLCKDRVIDLFIIDSTNGLCPVAVQSKVKDGEEVQERGLDKKNVAALPATLSNFYNIVNAQVFRAKAAVVWVGQLRTKGIGSYFVRDDVTGGNAQQFYAYQKIKMQRSQKTDNPKTVIVKYFLDPDGKLHKQSEKEDAGFGVVCKLEKTNSSKSAKEFSELALPYYYESGFKTSNEAEEKFRIDGTDEEKEIIRQKLIEKGVISEADPMAIPPSEDFCKEEPLTPEQCQALDNVKVEEPKKRGRKPNKDKK